MRETDPLDAVSAHPDPYRIVVIGGGPAGSAIVDRVIARARELIHDLTPLAIAVVDPFPVGPGRTWRLDQSPLMWANSPVAKINAAADSSVDWDGPPSETMPLSEWISQVAHRHFDPSIADEASAAIEGWFPSRRLVGEYLKWLFDRAVANAPSTVEVTRHRATAIDITGDAHQQHIHLDTGDVLSAQSVVLAQGRIDAAHTREERVFVDHSTRYGLRYVPSGYAADIDLSVIDAGAHVLIRGMGLSFIDYCELLTRGRGGTFTRDRQGALRYHPSGREPVLHVGSRRGVPHLPRIAYPYRPSQHRLQFFTPHAIGALADERSPLDLCTQLSPLIFDELEWTYYQQLFLTRADELGSDWASFDGRYRTLPHSDQAREELIASIVPTELRIDLSAALDPLAQRLFRDHEELQSWSRSHINATLTRRRDHRFDADAALSQAIPAIRSALFGLIREHRLSAHSAVHEFHGWWEGIVNYFAGIPAPRIEEVLALSEAGIVDFLGHSPLFKVSEESFRAETRHGHSVEASTLIEARLPASTISGRIDPLGATLIRRGELTEDRYTDSNGNSEGTGRIAVSPQLRTLRADGTAHPTRYAVGKWTAAPNVAALSAPGANSAFFHQSDALAREIVESALHPHPLDHRTPVSKQTVSMVSNRDGMN